MIVAVLIWKIQIAEVLAYNIMGRGVLGYNSLDRRSPWIKQWCVLGPLRLEGPFGIDGVIIDVEMDVWIISNWGSFDVGDGLNSGDVDDWRLDVSLLQRGLHCLSFHSDSIWGCKYYSRLYLGMVGSGLMADGALCSYGLGTRLFCFIYLPAQPPILKFIYWLNINLI